MILFIFHQNPSSRDNLKSLMADMVEL